METKEVRIQKVLKSRISTVDMEIQRRFYSSSQVVIFGSFALGLESGTSDLDVFCIGNEKTHYKNKLIEILILPEHEAYSDLWLESELANHIKKFGVCLSDKPNWYSQASLSARAEQRKRARISACLIALERHWSQLKDSSRSRFEVRVRREMQRLYLLGKRQAVPPTAVLDLEYAREGTVPQKECVGQISGTDYLRLQQLFPSLAKRACR